MIKSIAFVEMKDFPDEVKSEINLITRPGEVWKRLILNDTLTNYYVSNLGRFLGSSFKLMHPYKIGKSDLVMFYVKSVRNGRLHNYRCSKTVSQIVAEAFVPKPENSTRSRLFVLHKDGNIKNNMADNLYWSTKSNLTSHRYYYHKGKVNVLCVEDNICFGSIAEAAHAYNIAIPTLRQYLSPCQYDVKKGVYLKSINKTFKRVESTE